MVRAFGNTKHTLPDNPTWIEFKRTDGDPNRWPTDTTLVVRSGEVNYYRVVPDDESQAINWRKTIAKAVAMKMGMPGECSSINRTRIS